MRIGKAESDLKDYYAEDRLHRDVARDVARRSLVLLENCNQTLPLKRLAPSHWSARWPTRRST